MLRTIVGAMIGAALGLLAFAAWGAWDGYHYGLPTRRDLAPGFEAAAISALVYAMFLGWMGVVAGGVIGGGAGLGSALVRAISSSSRSPRPAPSA
jgi:hypothetical protein